VTIGTRNFIIFLHNTTLFTFRVAHKLGT
jgi:hypothetical protein